MYFIVVLYKPIVFTYDDSKIIVLFNYLLAKPYTQKPQMQTDHHK